MLVIDVGTEEKRGAMLSFIELHPCHLLVWASLAIVESVEQAIIRTRISLYSYALAIFSRRLTDYLMETYGTSDLALAKIVLV